MKAVILEDEVIAVRTLQKFIKEIRNDFDIVAILQTIEDSIEWFSNNPAPDLVFMDIHLADGSSFGIFEKVNIDCPIIFTTAYNEYALDAFEVNGIDYLLKPINKARLTRAINKFENLSLQKDNSQIINRLIETLNEKQNSHNTHFLVSKKDKLIPLAVENIAYFYADMKVAKAMTFNGHTYTIDHSLEELMNHLDSKQFYRVNRQYIVSHNAIVDLSQWFTGKLVVNLKVPTDEKIIVSKAKVSDFKLWLTKDITV